MRIPFMNAVLYDEIALNKNSRKQSKDTMFVNQNTEVWLHLTFYL